MEKYWIWYTLQLKAWCRKKICWMQAAGMLFVVYVILHITLPQQDNIQVGICNAKEGYAAEIADFLLQEDSVFTFLEYQDEETMGQDVSSGTIECGFVFADDFEQKFADAKTDGCVKYMETPFTTKGKVAKETFFASFFRVYGRIFLQKQVPDIFNKKQQEMEERLLLKNLEYRESDKVFSVEIKNVDTDQKGLKEAGVCYPVQGCIGIFLFAILLMAYGESLEKKDQVKNALARRDRYIYEYLNYFASATIAAAAGLAAVYFAESSRGVMAEAGKMLLYLLAGSLWMLVFGRLWRNRVSFLAWTAVLIMAQLLLYPVFFDFSEYVPALQYMRWVFPLSVYL